VSVSTEEICNLLRQLLPDWHADSDKQSVHGGKVIGEISYKDVRDIKAMIKRLEEPFVKTTDKPIALDVSLEKARALHRVWRALNDGDCPKCHNYHSAAAINRDCLGIMCPSCGFMVTLDEIEDIQNLFAPAMDAAVAIFEAWSEKRSAR
jgi:hypothetical protein